MLTTSTVGLSWNKLCSIDPVRHHWSRRRPTGLGICWTGQRDGGERQRLGGWQFLVLDWFRVFKPAEQQQHQDCYNVAAYKQHIASCYINQEVGSVPAPRIWTRLNSNLFLMHSSEGGAPTLSLGRVAAPGGGA